MAVQTAVLRHQSECTYTCRQAKQWVWPATRVWHALTGWPQASVEKPQARGQLQILIGHVMQSAAGAGLAALGALVGVCGPKARAFFSRDTGEALGELLATPLYACADLIGIGGATILSVLCVVLDTSGAAIGIVVGLILAPVVAYRAWHADEATHATSQHI